MSAAILTVEEVTSGYGGTTVLRDVSLALQPGEILAVLGKNGMGKSTLLKTIMGFLTPTAGRVTVGGTVMTGKPPHLMAGAGLAYAPQEFTIFQDLTVDENLRLGVQSDATYRERIEDLHDVFPRIMERRRQRAGTLSGGEQKMLLMSRALIARPRLMLIDEITEGLQPSMVTRMGEVLQRVRAAAGTSILIVEQHLAFALAIADRYAVLKLGEVIEEGRAGNPTAAAVVAEHMKV